MSTLNIIVFFFFKNCPYKETFAMWEFFWWYIFYYKPSCQYGLLPWSCIPGLAEWATDLRWWFAFCPCPCHSVPNFLIENLGFNLKTNRICTIYQLDNPSFLLFFLFLLLQCTKLYSYIFQNFIWQRMCHLYFFFTYIVALKL